MTFVCLPLTFNSLPFSRALPVLLALAAAPLSAQTPTPTPKVITPPGGGTITTATPTPLPSASVPLAGGTIITATPTPIPLPPATANAVAHERRLVRDIQQNTDNIKSKGNFGAQLWLIADGDFFQNWRKPEIPTLVPITVAIRSQPIYTPIIFYGPARDDKGLSNVSYDITVRRPDNSVYSTNPALVGFQSLGPADDRLILLGRNHATITIGPDDPAGLYTVEAVVHDNISRVDLPLVQQFVVQPQ